MGRYANLVIINGQGKIIKNKCPHCNGDGIVMGEEVVEIQIPAGVAEGMQQLRDGLNAMGWEDYWQNDYVPKYKAGMIEKYGEDYVNHP